MNEGCGPQPVDMMVGMKKRKRSQGGAREHFQHFIWFQSIFIHPPTQNLHFQLVLSIKTAVLIRRQNGSIILHRLGI